MEIYEIKNHINLALDVLNSEEWDEGDIKFAIRNLEVALEKVGK